MSALDSIGMILGAATMSAAAVLLFARVAPALGLLDTPGGRKQHHRAIPLVGGLAIFGGLFISAWWADLMPAASYFALSLSLVIVIGCWDDVTEISPRLKFGMQIAASAVMIWGAGVELRS